MWPLSARKIYEIIFEKQCENFFWDQVILHGLSHDSRKITPQQMFVAVKGDVHDGHKYLKSCLQQDIPLALVDKASPFLENLTPAERDKCLMVDDVIFYLRKLAKFFRQNMKFPVFGIAGSNGKTTTKEILFSMLQGQDQKITKTEKSENGFLGLALTLLQEEHIKDDMPAALVLEIGIDELGAMQKHIEIAAPDIVLLTALGPEHLRQLQNWDTAVQEELVLFSNQRLLRVWQLSDAKLWNFYFASLAQEERQCERNFVVIGRSELQKYNRELLQAGVSNNCASVVSWHVSMQGSSFSQIEISILGDTVQSYSFQFPLPGKHNAANFALAYAAAIAAGQSPENIVSGFQKFVQPPMRSLVYPLPNGALMINDAYNSSPFSLSAALNMLVNPEFIGKQKLVILGDMLDLGGESKYWHESLFPELIKLEQTLLCLYGSAMYSCYKMLQDVKDTLLQENQTKVFWLDKQEDLGLFFNKIDFPLSSAVILVKGSRGMQLERFIKLLEQRCAATL